MEKPAGFTKQTYLLCNAFVLASGIPKARKMAGYESLPSTPAFKNHILIPLSFRDSD